MAWLSYLYNGMLHKKIQKLYLTIMLLGFVSCVQDSNSTIQNKKFMYTNELIHESSPYLLQHAHNPVDWYPWGAAALEKAKKENKMLIISVGYAACHWCHVMEHESYEDTAVANLMNKNFVCIKVDREERPDVDQVYMNAAYLINGNGGWPLNALAMPDGKPFFAGTYYPKTTWMQLLEYFSNLYKTDPQKLQEQADHLAKGIRDIEEVPLNTTNVSFSMKTLHDISDQLNKVIDLQKGGTKGAMKFPMPAIWEYLLQYNYLSGNKPGIQAVETTLNNMANGGIYDQLGGGFSRYATDPSWHAPHFEKMLYDNAQLISLYSHAFQVTKNPLYKRIVYETIGFIQRELTSPSGGFYSSLDADSEGMEGKYYVWRTSEINDILGKDAALFNDYFGVTDQGNWENGENILDINSGSEHLQNKYQLTNEQLTEKINSLKHILFQKRNERVRPATDDKILTSWNALMIKALADAYRVFADEDFLKMAKTNLDFLLNNIVLKNGGIYRNYKNGKASINAFLDDYAFLVNALINFYQISFDESYLEKANELTQYVEKHFLDPTTGMYFYTDSQYSDLIARKMEISDNVIPSSNSEMAKNLLLLSLYFDNSNYEAQSVQMVKNVSDDIQKNPAYCSNWAQAMALQIRPPYEVAIVGKKWKGKLAAFQNYYLPNAIYLGGESEGKLPLLESKLMEGKTMIYVCENKTCKRPVEQVSEALQQLTIR